MLNSIQHRTKKTTIKLTPIKKRSGIITLCFIVLFTSCKSEKKEAEVTQTELEETEQAAKTTEASDVDAKTGVGKNGEATAINPAFVDEGGEVVTIDNVVRAEEPYWLVPKLIYLQNV